MARPHGNPDDLILRLEAALKVAKPSDVVGAFELASILKMTWRNLLSQHIERDEDFPIQRRGSEGLAWEFRVRVVLKHMLKRARQRKAENKAKAERYADLTGASVPEEDRGMPVQDLSKLIDMTLKARAIKREEGLYALAEEVAQERAEFLRSVRDFVIGRVAREDPVGSWPPDVAEFIRERDHSLLVDLIDHINIYEESSARLKPKGTPRVP